MRLREYQTIGRQFFDRLLRAALWAKPGMGKTATVLHALADLMLVGEVERTLVTAPMRVARDVWTDEVAKWPEIEPVVGRIVPIVGTVAERRRALATPAAVHTINYENLPWLVDETHGAWPFDTVVADEASKLRSFRVKQGGKRAHALGSFAHTKVRRFWELTGTPSANSLAALWGQAWFLDAGQRLGRTFEAFQQRWFTYEGDRGRSALVPLPFAAEQITEALRDICLTLRPEDWFDLREPVYTRVPVKLPAAAMQTYRKFAKEMYAELAKADVRAFNAAAKTMKCLQLANGAVYTDPYATVWEETHTAKLEALEEIVEETTDSAVLVAYQFKPDRARILKAFPKFVDLSTPRGMAAFKAGDAPGAVAHPASVGHGVDGLQRVCNALVFFGHWWDAEEREQIIERVGPMRQMQAGLDRPLMLYDLVAEKTVDEVVMARHATKRDVQDLLMEAMRRQA